MNFINYVIDKTFNYSTITILKETNIMKVLHYIPSIDRSSGGTTAYIQLLANELGKLTELHIVSHKEKHPINRKNSTIHYISPSVLNGMKKEWKKEYPDKKDHDKLSSSKLTSHINAMNKMDLVLTRNTIRLFLLKICYKHNIDKYIERYRQNYPQANFTTKTNLIELIKSIKKDLKKTLS